MATLAATLLPGLIKGFAGGMSEGMDKSPAEIQQDMARENRTAPGFIDFGSQLAKRKPNLGLQQPMMRNFGR